MEAGSACIRRGRIGEQVGGRVAVEDPGESRGQVVRTLDEKAACALRHVSHALPQRPLGFALVALLETHMHRHERRSLGCIAPRRQGHEATAVEREDGRARARRGVHERPQVDAPVGGAGAEQEPVGHEHHQLPAGYRREPPEDVLQGVTRRPGRVERLLQEVARHGLHLALEAGVAHAVGSGQLFALLDVADGEFEGLRVSSLDQLGLILRHVGPTSGVGAALAETDTIDRAPDGGSLAGEWLNESRDAARGDEGHLVLVRELLGHDLPEGGLSEGQAVLGQVPVVYSQHDVAALRPGHRRLSGAGRRYRRMATCRLRRRRWLEHRDRLGLAVLEQDEVLRYESSNRLTAPVHDHHVDLDELDRRGGGLLLRCGTERMPDEQDDGRRGQHKKTTGCERRRPQPVQTSPAQNLSRTPNCTILGSATRVSWPKLPAGVGLTTRVAVAALPVSYTTFSGVQVYCAFASFAVRKLALLVMLKNSARSWS